MKKFVLTYYGGKSADAIPKEEMQAVMDAWAAWYQDMGDAVVDPGNPFSPMSKEITEDGKVADLKPEDWPAKGYTIINAEDIDAAVAIAQKNPMIASKEEGAIVRVFEAMPM